MNKRSDELIYELSTLGVYLSATDAQRLEEIGRQLYEQGYIAGKEMQCRLLRLQLGLSVPEDRI